MTPYMIRDLELKSEENLRNERKSDNWKRRQELKLKDNTEVLDVNTLPRKKAAKDPKKKTKTVSIQRKKNKSQVQQGAVGKTDIPVVKDCCFFVLRSVDKTAQR